MFRNMLPAFVFCLALSPLAMAVDDNQIPTPLLDHGRRPNPLLEHKLFPNPLKDVRAGQWVVYPASWDNGEDEVEADERQTVVKVEGEGDGRILTLRKEILVDGKVVEEEEETFPLEELLEEYYAMFDEVGEATVTPIKLDVNGKMLDCVVVAFAEDGLEGKIYLSEAIPLMGIVRFEMEGLDDPIMPVKDFKK